jgi:hypothetical protein
MYQLSTVESDLKLNEEFIPLSMAKPHLQLTGASHHPAARSGHERILAVGPGGRSARRGGVAGRRRQQ